MLSMLKGSVPLPPPTPHEILHIIKPVLGFLHNDPNDNSESPEKFWIFLMPVSKEFKWTHDNVQKSTDTN